MLCADKRREQLGGKNVGINLQLVVQHCSKQRRFPHLVRWERLHTERRSWRGWSGSWHWCCSCPTDPPCLYKSGALAAYEWNDRTTIRAVSQQWIQTIMHKLLSCHALFQTSKSCHLTSRNFCGLRKAWVSHIETLTNIWLSLQRGRLKQ